MLRRHFLPLLALPAAAQSPTLDWHSAQKLRIEGLGFKDRKSPYDLFPLRAEGVVRNAVWTLSRDSSGVLVRFLTSSASLHARWTLTSKNLASANITATAASGLDLYAETDAGRRQWLSIGKPTKFPDASGVLVAKLPPAPAAGREFMLYLPLRNGVTSLEIGVSPQATVTPAAARPASRKPLAF